ncbi:MAG: DUF1819 family protein [Emergencia sp.]|nr:DUF1819 family protein [Emergencia sp.]
MTGTYNGGLTREQFLFYEIRTVAALLEEGLSREEALEKIKEENLFQFPTERMIANIASACFKRLDALDSASLRYQIAKGSQDVARQINLYAMMRYNRIVWDFMTTVIGEKFRTQELELTAKDMNLFFFRLQEQEDSVAGWSESTISKIKQVLKKSLIECGYLDGPRSETLNPIYLFPELEEGIRENGDDAAFAAFNYFE